MIAVLLLGAVLRTSGPVGAAPRDIPPDLRSEGQAAAGLPAEEPAAVAVPAPARSEPTLTHDDPLSTRAASDRARLVRSGGSYTVQLMAACDAANAARVVSEAANTSRLYVLPFTRDGKACYRLCWGSYPTRQSAESSDDLPAELRGLSPSTLVKAIGDLTS